MTNEYKENEQYTGIGRDLIENEEIFEMLKKHGTKILYLESEKEVKKNGQIIFAECKKMSATTKSLLTAGVIEENMLPDFFVIVYKERVKNFTPEQLRILIMHELLHIAVEEDSEGKPKYGTNKHDLNDFYYIVQRFGVDWAGDGQITWQQILKGNHENVQGED